MTNWRMSHVAEGDLACKLWMVDTDNFISSLLKPRVKVGMEWVSKGQNLEQVRGFFDYLFYL